MLGARMPKFPPTCVKTRSASIVPPARDGQTEYPYAFPCPNFGSDVIASYGKGRCLGLSGANFLAPSRRSNTYFAVGPIAEKAARSLQPAKTDALWKAAMSCG